MKSPGIKSKKDVNAKTEPTKTLPQGSDTLYAMFRHIRDDVTELRRVTTDLKRDVARIDRKQGREVKDELPPDNGNRARPQASGYATNWDR